MEDLRIIRSKVSPLDTDKIAINAMRRSRELELEDERIEREKMQRYQAMKSDPLWDLKAEITETEQKLKALKEELYQRSTKISMREFREAGVMFIESSAETPHIKFLGRS